MNHLAFQTVVLYAVLHFCHGNDVIQPRNLKVSMDLPLQQLLLEWDVSDDSETNFSEIKINFTIQIYRTEEKNIISTGNYTATLDKLNRPLKWSWVSDIPLQCARHGVRVRSKAGALSEAWSSWTPWEAVDGRDGLDDSKSYIFPVNKVVEEGSRVTFCCIAKENQHVYGYNFDNRMKKVNTMQNRVVFTETAVPQRSQLGFDVYCHFSEKRTISDRGATTFFVTRQPDEPRLLDCETEDMAVLYCTWHPGEINGYTNLKKSCLTEFILSDVSHTNTYCSCKDKCIQCQFKISGGQTQYNLTLVSKNCLGQKQANVNIDAARRVRLPPPDQLSVGYQNATMIQLHWNLKPVQKPLPLVCQINSFSPGGKEEQRNVTLSGPASHPHINLYGLRAYTKYALKVRCAVANDLFWKWSSWSRTITVQTNESAPSGQLDIWANVRPGLEGRNVTAFWKASPGFQANGNIKIYRICWGNVEQPIGCSSTKSSNYTISLDGQPYQIMVWASNSAGASPPSVLHISAAEENGDVNCSEENTTNNTAHGIYVSWKPTSRYDGYVVDWCNYPKSQPCDFQWKRFRQNESSTLITSGAFIPGVRYTFQVSGTQDNRMYLLEKKAKYLEELEPAQDRHLNIMAVTSTLLTVSWESYPENSQPGFIRGYNVYVKMENRNCTLEESEVLILPDNLVACKYTIKDRNEKKLTLRNLEPGTTYLLAVQPYSVIPRSISDQFESVTTQLEPGNWLQRLLPPLITVPLMVIICVCFWKSDCVRNCLFPDVPHPHVSPIKKSFVITEDRDVIPDRLLVMMKPDISIDNQLFWGRAIENATYFNPNGHQSPQNQEDTTKKPTVTSTGYKSFQDLVANRPSISCLPEAGQNNLNYVSQTKVPLLGVSQNASPSFKT